jgi:hypothetical protein
MSRGGNTGPEQMIKEREAAVQGSPAQSASVRVVRYTGSYALLLALHLVGVLLIVGPLAAVTTTAGRLARTGDVPGLTRAVRATRVLTFATLAVVGLGSALLDRDPTRIPQSAGWVSAAYALWLVAALINLVLVVPALRGALAEATEGRPAERFAARLGAFGGVSALCWAAIVVLMVYKPGQ